MIHMMIIRLSNPPKTVAEARVLHNTVCLTAHLPLEMITYEHHDRLEKLLSQLELSEAAGLLSKRLSV